MAGILQLRRGLKSTYISEGTNLAEAFFVTENNSLLIGTSGSVGDDVITLAKLSMANKDNTLAEANTGSFWITNDYTGSHMYLSNNLTASYAWFKNDVKIDGHLIMGDDRPIDVVTVKSHFSGSLIPDNDDFGTLISTPDLGYHDLGSDSQRWKDVYLTAGTNNFLSGSNIDLTGNIKVDGEGRFGTLRVDDLTNNRVLLAGVDGEVEDSPNFTFDGDDLNLTGSYYQSGSGATFRFIGSGGIISASLTVEPLAINDGIVFTDAEGTLDNSVQLRWNGNYVDIDGGMTASRDISVNREAYLESAVIKDLTDNRIVLSGQYHEIEDDANLTFDGIELNVGQDNFTVQQATGNTFTSGTLHTDGQATLASANIEDLTTDRVVIVGTDGELEDDENFTFDATELNIGLDNFTVQVSSGNVHTSGTLDVDGQATLASANIEDLTNNRVVIVGTDGELEDDENFTFDATELNIGTGNFTVQQGSGDTQIVGTLDVDAQSTLASLNVEDLTSGRVVLAGTDGEIEDSENLTFDGNTLTVTGNTIITGDLTVTGDTTTLNVGELVVEDKNIVIASGALDASAANGAGITIEGANANLTYESANDWFTFNKDTQVQGDLYVTNDISSSTVNGIGNVEIYSASVDSRLDYLEGPFSTSVDSRLDDAEWTGSNHETRVIDLELTGSDHELRLLESFATASDHETRVIELESTGSDHELRLLESFTSASDHEIRILDLALTGSDHETRIDSLESSYATTGSNIFNGDQTISGSLTVSGSSTFTGSVDISGSLVVDGEISSSTIIGMGNVELFSASLDGRIDSLILSGVPAGTISGSSQVDITATTNFTTFSSSLDSRIESLIVGGVPAGTISGSQQVIDALPDGILSSSNELETFNTFSSSVDLRLLESFSTSSDHELRLLESFTSASDHELRLLESFETSSDHELRLLESFTSASDHETRIQEIEDTNLQSFISSSTYTILDVDNKSTIFLSSSTDITVTIDTLTTSNFECNFYNLGSTTASFQDGTATVGYPDGTKLEQDKVAALTRVMGTDIYKLKGELN